MPTRKYTSLPYAEYLVADGRYDTLRQPIQYIVLHTMVGTAQSAINLFATPPAPGKETSAHYGVRYDGGIIAWLEEYNTAYHCGNLDYNRMSIGIEHEDMRNYNSPRPDALYETSAKLVADICKFYSIPCDSTHILRHNNVPGSSTACPDSLDTNRIISSAQKILGGNPPMNDKRPGWFDLMNKVIWNKGWEQLTDADINKFVLDYPTQLKRSGMWDQLCQKAGLSGDTNKITVQQLFDTIKGLGGNISQFKSKVVAYVNSLS